MPFVMNNMFEIGQLQNGTSENSSNVATNNNQQDLVGCDMPQCPQDMHAYKAAPNFQLCPYSQTIIILIISLCLTIVL